MTGIQNAAPAAPGDAPPRSYRLIVPSDWYRIDLDPGRSPTAVRALADRQFRGIDNQPALRRDLITLLDRQCDQARTVGGLELYIATTTIGPMPLAASLLVTLLPAPIHDPIATAALDPTDWRDDLRADGHHADLVDLPAGTAVRTRRRTMPTTDDPLGNTLPTTNLDLRIPVPQSAAYLLLSFATPLDPLADALVDLFDSVATSLRWTP